MIFPDENGMETEKKYPDKSERSKGLSRCEHLQKKTRPSGTDIQGAFSFSELSGGKVKVSGHTRVHHRGGTGRKCLSPLLDTELSCLLMAACWMLGKASRGR